MSDNKQKPSQVTDELTSKLNSLMEEALAGVRNGTLRASDVAAEAKSKFDAARKDGLTGPAAIAQTIGMPENVVSMVTPKPTPENTAKKEEKEEDKKENEKFIEMSKMKVFGLICLASLVPGVSFVGSAVAIAGGIWGMNKLMENKTVRDTFNDMKSKVVDFMAPGKTDAVATNSVTSEVAPSPMNTVSLPKPSPADAVKKLDEAIDNTGPVSSSFSLNSERVAEFLRQHELNTKIKAELEAAATVEHGKNLNFNNGSVESILDKYQALAQKHADANLNLAKKDLPKPSIG